MEKKATRKKTTKKTDEKGKPIKAKKVTKGVKVKKEPAKKETKKGAAKPVRYFEAIGRRKTAVARVRLLTRGEKAVIVNEKPYEKYFPGLELQQIIISSLKKMKALDRFRVSVKVKGGGFRAQAEAVRHGIARALVKFNPDFRKRLRRAGYLTRDARMRERKKFGLKRARRAPQWQKR